MFSGNTKGDNEQSNKNIIPISSRENFESRLKMFSSIPKENPQQIPSTWRSYDKSINQIVGNKDFEKRNNNVATTEAYNQS